MAIWETIYRIDSSLDSSQHPLDSKLRAVLRAVGPIYMNLMMMESYMQATIERSQKDVE